MCYWASKRSKMKKKSKKQTQRDNQIYYLTSLAAGKYTLQEVLDRLAKAAVETVKVKACSIRLLDEKAGDLKMSSTFGLTNEYRKKGPVSKNDPVIKEAFAGNAVVIGDMSKDVRIKYQKAAKNEGLVSQLTVAMKFRDKAVGVLRLYSPKLMRFNDDDIAMARVVATQCAVALKNARYYRQALAGAKMAEQMRLAGVIQRRMVPKNSPKIENMDIAATYIPCFAVGGDFYDFISVGENKLVIVIADVMGKGLPASIVTSSIRGSVRAYVKCLAEKGDMLEIVKKINQAACLESRNGEFISLFYAVVDTKEKTIEYCNCGHEPAIIIRDGKTVDLDKGGLVLGVIDDAEYVIGKMKLEKNDAILFYTDGLIDAANFQGQLWGRKAMLKTAKKFAELNAKQMMKNMLRYRRRFVGLARQLDDTSMVVVKVNG